EYQQQSGNLQRRSLRHQSKKLGNRFYHRHGTHFQVPDDGGGRGECLYRKRTPECRYDETGIKGMVVRGHHPTRSGSLVYILEQGWLSSGDKRGTTHGSPYTYDTHVPILFYGAGIKAGSSVRYHPVTDIAPTLSMLLRIKFPSSCTGQPI